MRARPSSTRRSNRGQRQDPADDGKGITSLSRRVGSMKAAWDDVTVALKEFTRVCFLDEVSQELLGDFGRAEQAYRGAASRIAALFNSARPWKAVTIIRPTRTMEMSCDTFVQEWDIFQDDFTYVWSMKGQPIYGIIYVKLVTMGNLLGSLSMMIAQPHPLVSVGVVRKLKESIDGLRARTMELAFSANGRNQAPVNNAEFLKGLNTLNSGVRRLFANGIPKGLAGSVAVAERESFIAIDEMYRMYVGVQQFEGYASNLRSASDVFVAVANELFDTLGFPVKASVCTMPEETALVVKRDTRLEPESESERQDITDPDPTEPRHAVDKLRSRLCELEVALDGAAQLFK